jgi:hypothetical protein
MVTDETYIEKSVVAAGVGTVYRPDTRRHSTATVLSQCRNL